ncbi:hypothetical protein [Hymenobacter sp. B1770]|uniref:hypothetical protein n=1 Tax=Hymenobacter sp. B1770 TaxID=1718788 RepID=UPI003CF60154
MQITHAVRGLLIAGGAWLAACNGPAAQSPVEGDAPASAATPTVMPDSTRKGQSSSGPVPFVNPTKAGRLFGPQTPSPPASRNR